MKEHLLRVLDTIRREWKRLKQKLETLHCMFKYRRLLWLIFECFPFLVSTHQLRIRSVFKYHSVFQMSAVGQTASCLGENTVWSSDRMGFLSSSTGHLLGAPFPRDPEKKKWKSTFCNDHGRCCFRICSCKNVCTGQLSPLIIEGRSVAFMQVCFGGESPPSSWIIYCDVQKCCSCCLI